LSAPASPHRGASSTTTCRCRRRQPSAHQRPPARPARTRRHAAALIDAVAASRRTAHRTADSVNRAQPDVGMLRTHPRLRVRGRRMHIRAAHAAHHRRPIGRLDVAVLQQRWLLDEPPRPVAGSEEGAPAAVPGARGGCARETSCAGQRDRSRRYRLTRTTARLPASSSPAAACAVAGSTSASRRAPSEHAEAARADYSRSFRRRSPGRPRRSGAWPMTLSGATRALLGGCSSPLQDVATVRRRPHASTSSAPQASVSMTSPSTSARSISTSCSSPSASTRPTASAARRLR
jgi:hypothetical protein